MCKFCGMSRDAFAHSRMLIEYSDGTKIGMCSIRCAALALATNPGKRVKSMGAADFNTRMLIDARNAEWIIGGKIDGVMSSRAKWAFADKAAAKAFIVQNGGTLINFDEAMKAAYEDLYTDTKMIQDELGAEELDQETEPLHSGHEEN